jgi:2-methylaconitate cis-trans-isomerase PrpF
LSGEGSAGGIYFEGKNVPPAGNGLEEFFLAVRGSPDSLAMDGLGGDHTFFITSSHHAGMQVTGDGCPR